MKKLQSIIKHVRGLQKKYEGIAKEILFCVSKLEKMANAEAVKLWKKYFGEWKKFTYEVDNNRLPIFPWTFVGGCLSTKWEVEPLYLYQIIYGDCGEVHIKDGKWMGVFYDGAGEQTKEIDIPVPVELFERFLKELSENLGIEVKVYGTSWQGEEL